MEETSRVLLPNNKSIARNCETRQFDENSLNQVALQHYIDSSEKLTIDYCLDKRKMIPREQPGERVIEKHIDTTAFLEYAQELLTELEILSRRLELEDLADCLTTSLEAAARSSAVTKTELPTRRTGS